MKNMIGKKFVLWHEEYVSGAYKDQMGVSHSGYVVSEQILVTVIETKKVPVMWGKGEDEGWKAISDAGEEFTCNWNSFPDDSMTPTYYWDARKDARGLWQPVDGIQTYNQGTGVHCNSDGTKCKPLGANICKKHNYAYLDGEECFRCECM